ncbi:MAG: hypothetical protein OS130_14630 [Thermodesulfobacteriota bacterium]|jgi:hypothetical protein|nr:MAG: hypothetical protein OS130_14630 [Thermodesulfobacteriota bacterium]
MKEVYLKRLLLLSILIVFIGLSYTQAHAVTQFGQFMPGKKPPAEFSFDDIWFDSEGAKMIPDISMNWLTVVFDPRYTNVNMSTTETGEVNESFIQEKAKALISSNSNLRDFLYDKNLAEDACFFRLREGMTAAELKQLIVQLNQDEAVNYIHPTIILNNKIYAFFNALRIKWKAGADTARKDRLLRQVFAVFDKPENLYRVNVLEIPFFTALHLLGEDIGVLEATPYLMEIKPTIRVNLGLTMNGARIGDSIPFTFTIVFSDRVSIDPSSVSNINLRPFNLQRELFDTTFDPYDPTKVVLRSPVRITGTITCYASGEFVLPPVNISYSCQECSGNPVRSVESKTIPFKVSSLLPTAKEGNRLLVPTNVIQPDFQFDTLRTQKKWFFTAALVTLVLFFVCVGWVVVLSYRAKKERGELMEKTKDEFLAEELRQILLSPIPTPHWKYLTDAGTLVRKYIAARYHIPREHLGGSGNQFVNSISNHLPENCTGLLHTILETVDNAVALELETYPDLAKLRTDIATLIDFTTRQNNYEVKNYS